MNTISKRTQVRCKVQIILISILYFQSRDILLEFLLPVPRWWSTKKNGRRNGRTRTWYLRLLSRFRGCSSSSITSENRTVWWFWSILFEKERFFVWSQRFSFGWVSRHFKLFSLADIVFHVQADESFQELRSLQQLCVWLVPRSWSKAHKKQLPSSNG